jgi:hypothetical protein
MRRTIIIATILFILDVFIFNQGTIALITLLIALPVMIVKALLCWKNKPLLKKRFVACGIYLIMAILILTSNAINNQIAKSRAEKLITACGKYKDRNNKYPENLSDLAPDFIKKIPVAKYTLMSNQFFYMASKDSHLLFYMAIPPFGRPTYNFEKQKWIYLD